MERQLTMGEKCFVGVVDSKFMSEYEKLCLSVTKIEKWNEAKLAEMNPQEPVQPELNSPWKRRKKVVHPRSL